MPGFNGTGPLGNGPGTGWGQGPCMAGSNVRRNSRGLGGQRGNMGRGGRNKKGRNGFWDMFGMNRASR